jgi:protease II
LGTAELQESNSHLNERESRKKTDIEEIFNDMRGRWMAESESMCVKKRKKSRLRKLTKSSGL